MVSGALSLAHASRIRAKVPMATAAGAALGLTLTLVPSGLRDIAFALPFIAAAIIDARTQRVPNVLTAGATAMAIAASVGTDPLSSILGWAIAAAVGLALAFLARGGFGMGDVKLIAFGGAAVGMANTPYFLFSMALAGGVLTVAGLLLGRIRRSERIPYAPAIAVGGILTLLLR